MLLLLLAWFKLKQSLSTKYGSEEDGVVSDSGDVDKVLRGSFNAGAKEDS